MNSGFSQYGQIVFVLVGIYCIYRGITILMTGRLGAKEEATLRGYSAEGIRRYKLLSAVMNIVSGVVVAVLSVLRMLNVIDLTLYRIILLCTIGVLVVCYFIVKNICRNVK